MGGRQRAVLAAIGGANGLCAGQATDDDIGVADGISGGGDDSPYPYLLCLDPSAVPEGRLQIGEPTCEG